MKKVVWVAGIILVLVVGYVAAGPYLTVSAIKTGIVDQDSEKLSENIEFPKLRQNLKDQLNVVMIKMPLRIFGAIHLQHLQLVLLQKWLMES